MDRDDSRAEAIRDDLSGGQTLRAFDAIRKLQEREPEDVVLGEMEARALRDLGAPDRAREVLLALRKRGVETPEVLGLLASFEKDAALATPPGNEESDPRADALRHALESYREMWSRHKRGKPGGLWDPADADWPGINVATLAYLLGDRTQAEEAARQVIAQLEGAEQNKDDPKERVWTPGTLGEAYLLRGDVTQAKVWYTRCRQAAKRQGAWKDLRSVRKNAELILGSEAGRVVFSRDDASEVRQTLTPPPVAICVGHMVDEPDRRPERFPEKYVDRVRQAIAAWMGDVEPSFAFSSMARGADLLFQEVAADLGVGRHVLLPFPAEEFRTRSVDHEGEVNWPELFDSLWASPKRTYVAARWPLERDAICFQYGNEYLTGMARIRADELGTDLVGFALYDGGIGRGPGGTPNVLKMWREHGVIEEGHLTVRTPASPDVEQGSGGALSWETTEQASGPGVETEIHGLLFADAKGFSKLDEEQAAKFVDVFLRLVAEVLAPYREHMFEVNTWGDGLFFATPNLEALGRFALDLKGLMSKYREELLKARLPEDMQLRIALHAGPVYTRTDPLSIHPEREDKRVLGTQVSHAARIEPVTPPGQVYASEAFAALSRARGISAYRCSYVGELELAKDHGSFRTYVVQKMR